jgi:hypothetical protein
LLVCDILFSFNDFLVISTVNCIAFVSGCFLSISKNSEECRYTVPQGAQNCAFQRTSPRGKDEAPILVPSGRAVPLSKNFRQF